MTHNPGLETTGGPAHEGATAGAGLPGYVPMFENRHTRNFYSAPQSVTSLIAAFLEPTITVSVYLLALLWSDEPVLRPDLTLCLLVFALTFPGRNRFRDRYLTAAVDIASSWLMLLLILALCGYATRSLNFFETDVLLFWALLTPVLQMLGMMIGRRVLQWQAVQPENRHGRPRRR